MWTCPDCGRRFAAADAVHACTHVTIEEHLEGRSDHAKAIFRAIAEAMTATGPHRVHAQYSRIAFISRMTFANAVLADHWVDLSLTLPSPVDEPWVRRLELFGPTSFAHTARLTEPADLADGPRDWLAAALLRGKQETLDTHAKVEPLTGRSLEIVEVPFRSRVLRAGESPLLWVPRYAVQALAGAAGLQARIQGEVVTATLSERDGRPVLELLGVTLVGLDEGDPADVYLSTADGETPTGPPPDGSVSAG